MASLFLQAYLGSARYALSDASAADAVTKSKVQMQGADTIVGGDARFTFFKNLNVMGLFARAEDTMLRRRSGLPLQCRLYATDGSEAGTQKLVDFKALGGRGPMAMNALGDTLYLAQHPQSQRQPRVDAWSGTTHVAGTNQQFVTGNFGVRGIVTQGTQEQVGQTGNHEV